MRFSITVLSALLVSVIVVVVFAIIENNGNEAPRRDCLARGLDPYKARGTVLCVGKDGTLYAPPIGSKGHVEPHS